MTFSDKNNSYGTIEDSSDNKVRSKYGFNPNLPFELASLSQRAIAALIDNFLISAVLLPVMIKMDLLKELQTIETQVEIFLLWFVTLVILNGYLLFFRGQTLGKLAVGTKIIGMTGNILSLEKVIFLRYLPVQMISQIPIIGQIIAIADVLMIFNPDRRCIHDHIAGTVVVTYKNVQNKN